MARPRDLLYELTRSANMWERRTAMLATMQFLRVNQHDDAYAIARILQTNSQDLIHKVVGGVLRFAGDKDQPRLLAYLEQNAKSMPRTMLRYAIEHLNKPQKSSLLAWT